MLALVHRTPLRHSLVILTTQQTSHKKANGNLAKDILGPCNDLSASARGAEAAVARVYRAGVPKRNQQDPGMHSAMDLIRADNIILECWVIFRDA